MAFATETISAAFFLARRFFYTAIYLMCVGVKGTVRLDLICMRRVLLDSP